MNDHLWYIKILKCKQALMRYHDLLLIVENEYEMRYGHNPTEACDEAWVAFLQKDEDYFILSLDEIKQNAEEASNWLKRQA